MRNYSHDIYNAIVRTLQEERVRFEADEERGVCECLFHNDDPDYPILKVQFQPRLTSFIIYGDVQAGFNTKDARLVNTLMEFLCRANDKLYFGSFKATFEHCQVYYYNFVDCSGLKEPTPEMIKLELQIVCEMWRRFMKGLRGVLYEGMTARAAAELCEFL